AQAAVDGESGVIVAATLTNVAPDMGHLPDLVADVRGLRDVAGLSDAHLTIVSADTGYFSGENAAEDRDGLDLLIAARRDHPAAGRRYARRKAIVEPVFGQLKDARGFTTLTLRGLARAAGEYLLACLAHNLGKLLRVCPLPSARPVPAAA